MRPTRRFAALAAAAGMLAVFTPTAAAHDVVIGGDPDDGEVLQQFPDSLTLEFSGIPRDGFNTFAVSEVDSGEVLFTGEPTIDDRHLTVELPEDLDPGAGEYQIGFQITSSDGHSTRGRTTFSVEGEDRADAASSPAAGDTDVAAEEDTDGAGAALGGPLALVVAAAAILGVIAVAVLAVRRGKTSRELDEHLRNQHPDDSPEHK